MGQVGGAASGEREISTPAVCCASATGLQVAPNDNFQKKTAPTRRVGECKMVEINLPSLVRHNMDSQQLLKMQSMRFV